MTDDEWLDYLRRWDAVLDGLSDRLGPDLIEEIRDEGVQEPFLGIGGLLGGHEQGMWDLTPAEEDELWELASLNECSDDLLIDPSIRAETVRGRPVRRVRAKHPLRGGGHGAGRGLPGKREFPASWSDDDAMAHTMDLARRPDGAVKLPTGDWRAVGDQQGVRMSVLVSPTGDVLTSYPVTGPGVVQNPLDEWRTPAVDRLQRLLDELVPAGSDEPRASLDELLAVGEWSQVVAVLRALHLPLTETQQRELDELTKLAALPT